MPEVSDKKVEQLNELKEKIYTKPREAHKPQDYLEHVYEINKEIKE